jgi:hypothetical protein
MKRLTILAALAVAIFAADAQAEASRSIKLDAPGEWIAVSREGASVLLVVRVADGNDEDGISRPRLNRQQAIKLADSLDEAIRKLGKPTKEDESAADELNEAIRRSEDLDARIRVLTQKVYPEEKPTIGPTPPDDESDFDEYGWRKQHHWTNPPNEGELVYVRKSDASVVLCKYRNGEFQGVSQRDVLSWRRPDKSSSASEQSVFRLVSIPRSSCGPNGCSPDTSARQPTANTTVTNAGRLRLLRRALRPLGRVLGCGRGGCGR